ncbi:MAG: alanine--tRNA ligase [Bacteroidota bacterium]
MDAKEIRSRFLRFFEERGHKIVPSAPIVNKDDPTLMFINAGMNPFKDYLTGAKTAQDPRIADTQKCLRVSGKHNDLDEVGFDTYHHTMFEMLGNWSFGDYFKKEAIAMAWELLTDELGIDKERLYITVFEGDPDDNLPRDEEAAEFWKAHVPEERIIFCSKKDNFWEMGDVGPCGPCSEIHIDLRSDAERAKSPGAELVNADRDDVIEIWNLVFIQYDRKADGKLAELPLKSIDTGMGLERLALVLQGVSSTYDTDLFKPLMAHLEQKFGVRYGAGEKMVDVAIRVAVDHIRAAAFAIADGQLPGNNGAGYVIRRIIRRASRFGYQYFDAKAPFLFELIDILKHQFEDVFPSMAEQYDLVRQSIEQEEKSFLRTLEQGLKRFEEYIAEHADKSDKVIDGDFAFELYDTFGFPVDLTQLMAREQGWSVDLAGFEAGLKAQRERSRAAQSVETGDWTVLRTNKDGVAFVGYDQTEAFTEILQFREQTTKKGKSYQIVLETTPFYAESGGQVGDTGRLTKGGEIIRVLDTKYENELIVHICDRLPSDPTGSWHAEIDVARRNKIRANHSATHLLHAALREVLGEHVEQRGSLVGPDYLRFDFSHFQGLTDEETKRVEDRVNERISAAIPAQIQAGMPIEEAKAMGAMALFGEKYGETVRVVQFDPAYSTELCGGIHVTNTLEIRYFRIVSEGSIAAGIRRIEAVTGEAAFSYVDEQLQLLDEVYAQLKQPKELTKAIEQLQTQNKQLEKALKSARAELLKGQRQHLLESVQAIGEVNAICQQVDVISAEELKTLVFELQKQLEHSVIALGAEVDGKVLLNIAVDDALTDRYQAGALVKAAAQHIKGGGGGKPNFASAGGKNPAGLPDALAAIRAELSA